VPEVPSFLAAERRHHRAWGVSPRNSCAGGALVLSRGAAASYSLGREPQDCRDDDAHYFRFRAPAGRHQALHAADAPRVSPPWGLRQPENETSWGSRPRLYDSAPLRELQNQGRGQRQWDDHFWRASPTFQQPSLAPAGHLPIPLFHTTSIQPFCISSHVYKPQKTAFFGSGLRGLSAELSQCRWARPSRACR
jgi:hypothetical protein